jgi:transposase
MNKVTSFFGIDISKSVFDVIGPNDNHYIFENSTKGFRKFIKLLDEHSVCVMEATGCYHLQLAYFLVENQLKVCIVNPLSVKRFVQMQLSKIKTDKADAKMIREYARSNQPPLWFGQSENQVEALQLTRLLDLYTRQSTALKNKLHVEKTMGKTSGIVIKSLKSSLKKIIKEQEQLENKLISVVKEEYPQLLSNIESIPGIGRKTACMFIVLTDGFNRFDSSAALCSYCGTTPFIKKSGSSVNGRPRISKMGSQKLRNLLFLCSFTACVHNKACKEIYTRITNKGKSKKLALIAVSNKLVKQAFAIAKTGIPYDNEYKSYPVYS